MVEFYSFDDIVTAHEVGYFVSRKQLGYEDPNNGNKWVPGTTNTHYSRGAVVPVSSDDLKNEANGMYTTKDRKIYTKEKLEIGDIISYGDYLYTVHQQIDYGPYTDIYIYYAKSESRDVIT